MSAPAEKYSIEYFKAEIGGIEKKLIRQALAKSEYVSNSRFKQLFHVDKVWHRKTKSNREVVIGLCNANSSNLKYHATTRLAKLKIVINNVTYRPFTDSGLNTKAEASVNDAVIKYSNYLKLDGNIFSAYYAKTDNVKISAQNLTTNRTLFSDMVVATNTPAQAILEHTFWIIQASGQANVGDRISLTITATNSEGELSTTFQFICDGTLDDVVFWQQLSTQNQDPTTGTQYVVVPTVEQWNYIQRFLEEHPTPFRWDATNEHGGLMAPLKGAQGNDFSEAAITTQLPAGHYYVVSGLDNAVILLVDNNGEVYGWCLSSYYPPAPVNPLNNVTITVIASYTLDSLTNSVVITDMSIELSNADNSSMTVGVNAVMIDGQTNVAVGATTMVVPSGESVEDVILDSEKDEPVRYTSIEGTPTVRITLTYGSYTKSEDIQLAQNL